jgi:hypothetical protein
LGFWLCRAHDIIGFRFEEEDRGPQVTDSLLHNWRPHNLGGNLFWKPREQSACGFHRFLPRHQCDNHGHHIPRWRNRSDHLLCQEHAATGACLAVVRHRRDFSSASSGTGAVARDKRCSIYGGSAAHDETGIASQSPDRIPKNTALHKVKDRIG